MVGPPYLARRHPFSVRLALSLVIALSCTHPAAAALTVLVGEPFGSFGTMMPNGHTAIYLDRVCADGPLRLKMCDASEAPGVVIARYFHLGETDWVAVPILQFLYATDRVEDIPTHPTADQVETMRGVYRQRFLTALVPDESENDKRAEEWRETAGMAYLRRIWGYEIATSREEDERFVAAIDAQPNRRHYSVIRANCANFAADVVNFYRPGTVRANHLSDLGILSPKQVARRVATYGKTHHAAEMRVLEIPQVAGPIRRSHPVRGGAEGFLKTKRYLTTLLIFQPEVVLGLTAFYLDNGRWKLGRNAEVIGPQAFEAPVSVALSTH